jgi:ribosome-binding protein aMBF1 (putative translation factor)
MLGHTRKHHTSKSSRAKEHQSEEKTTPWLEVFSEGIEEFTEVGLMLKGARTTANLTQKELAEKIGVKTHHISEMEHGKRSIGKAMARRLASIFKLDYRLFL